MPFNLPACLSQHLSNEPFTEVNELRIHVPIDRPSLVLETVSQINGISLRTGSAHMLELVLNNENDGKMKDLRPALPLIIRW